jgi:hypothetical protein
VAVELDVLRSIDDADPAAPEDGFDAVAGNLGERFVSGQLAATAAGLALTGWGEQGIDVGFDGLVLAEAFLNLEKEFRRVGADCFGRTTGLEGFFDELLDAGVVRHRFYSA